MLHSKDIFKILYISGPGDNIQNRIERELTIRILSTTLLQKKCKFMPHFKVILKSKAGPDDTLLQNINESLLYLRVIFKCNTPRRQYLEKNEGELIFRTLTTTLLQIFYQFMFYSKVIFKSTTGPDDTGNGEMLIFYRFSSVVAAGSVHYRPVHGI